MLTIHIDPDQAPHTNLPLQYRLMTLLTRAAAMGVLAGVTLTRMDAESLRSVIGALQQEKLLSGSTLDLAPLLREGPGGLDAATAARMSRAVDEMVQTLGESPSPATEWATMREVFGDEVLARLAGISETSLRRYASAARSTPQAVAEKLHWLAMVVADLSGGYNDFGMRRWFERPRAQLDGLSPRALLGARWTPDDAAAQRVSALAATLSGAQPLAA